MKKKEKLTKQNLFDTLSLNDFFLSFFPLLLLLLLLLLSCLLLLLLLFRGSVLEWNYSLSSFAHSDRNTGNWDVCRCRCAFEVLHRAVELFTPR